LKVLRQLGFGQIWCDIISGLLASSSTQVILNGTPGERIEYKRGLRQGDPLSLILFVIVMDVLGFMIRKVEEKELLQPFCNKGTFTSNLNLC
jgi:hypothetical protein